MTKCAQCVHSTTQFYQDHSTCEFSAYLGSCEFKPMQRKPGTVNGLESGIKIQGHRGTWYIMSKAIEMVNNVIQEVYLLEHEQYGDESACLIVDYKGNILLDDVWNGFESLH